MTANGTTLSRAGKLGWIICAASAPTLMLALITGCVTKSPRPPEKSVSFAASLPALIAAGDSAGIARGAKAECASARAPSDCYEKLAVSLAESGNVRLAMGTFNRLGDLDEGIRRDGHVYAHAIGITAGKAVRDVAAAFTQCTETFQSGCYHGIVQAYFSSADSVGKTSVNALCEPFRAKPSDRWIRFQCVHGMGHGLTMYYSHNLPQSLKACDFLAEWWDRHSCYGGAFMENIVNVTMPHHPAKALKDTAAAHGEHADHHADASPVAYKAIDAADPLYPCSALPERYLPACYEMQTSVILYHNKGNIGAAAKTCDTAPVAMRSVCYKSLGRDISAYSAQNHAEAVRMCSLGTEKYQRWCYYGLVKNFIDLNARAEDGLAFCRKVPEGPSKVVCYTAVGEQVMVLRTTADERRSLCELSEDAYKSACLYGAEVVTVPPPALAEVWKSSK